MLEDVNSNLQAADAAAPWDTQPYSTKRDGISITMLHYWLGSVTLHTAASKTD